MGQQTAVHANEGKLVTDLEDAIVQVLVVDDQVDNLLIIEDMLASLYRVHTARDGDEALAFLRTNGRVDLILLDVVMPGIDGFEVCRQIKTTPDLADIPVLFLTSLDKPQDEERGLALGADDFIHKPFNAPVVLARVRNHLKLAYVGRALRDQNEQLAQQVEQRTREIRAQTEQLVRHEQRLVAAQAATIAAFCSLAEVRDNETGNHIRRTQNYVRALAERLRDHPRFRADLTDDAIDLLFRSAPLHDVGKVAIPDAILLKPGKLDADEWEIMQRHCEYGRLAIMQAEEELGADQWSFLRYAREIAYCHHEKWDGSGYPQGLSGDAIPVSARLMAVADVYDALISKRVYKPAFSHEKACAIIAEGRGTHFDPDIADAMLSSASMFNDIALRYRDEENTH
ncbi:MAG: response regulator [Gammaproteobacteria bacterium]|nr:response regulator [Gammaproteobacteria bacterium]